MMHDQAVHERRGADDRVGVWLTQRRARRSVSSGDARSRRAGQVDPGPAQPAALGVGVDAGRASGSSGRPRRSGLRPGRTRRGAARPRAADTRPSSTVSMPVDAMPNHRFAVRSIDFDGSTRAIDSLVISVSTASVGVISRLTPNPRATPANAAAMPASGCRPTLANATAPSGISTRVAGVRGDGGEDAEEDDDVGERGGDVYGVTSLRISGAISPETLGYPDADHDDQDDPHRGEPHEVADERREQERGCRRRSAGP